MMAKHGFALTLNEIMYNPAGADNTDEFVELYNESQFAASVSGWRLVIGADTDAVVAMEQGLIAAPHQYVLIMDPDYFAQGSTTYDGRIPSSALVVTIDNTAFGSRGLVNDRSDTLTLIDAQGHIRSRYAYHIGNTEGFSDEKILPQDGDSLSNWRDSAVLYGTPGARNSVTPPDRDLAVTAFFAEPSSPQSGDSFSVTIQVTNVGRSVFGDSLSLYRSESGNVLTLLAAWPTGTLSVGDSARFSHRLRMESNAPLSLVADLSGADEIETNDRRMLLVGAAGAPLAIVINEIMFSPEPQRSEWVELFNPSAVPWNLAGWRFSDGTGIGDTSRRVNLPDVTIAPQSFALLASDSTMLFENVPANVPTVIWNTTHVTLNNSGDSLVLYSADGQMIDRVDYRPSWSSGVAGISIERVASQAASNDLLNWASCLDSTGSTPGRPNSRAMPFAGGGVEVLRVQPNPFSPDGDGRNEVLSIQYRLEQPDSRLDLKIYDVRGRLIRRLANNEAAGYSGEKLWDGKDDHGRMMPTGLYIIYLEALGKGGTRIQTARRPVALARRS
ncbi:MAG TPA: lamin tail domain-containing protein [bacterium]